MYPEIHKNPKNLDTQKKITVLTILKFEQCHFNSLVRVCTICHCICIYCKVKLS